MGVAGGGEYAAVSPGGKHQRFCVEKMQTSVFHIKTEKPADFSVRVHDNFQGIKFAEKLGTLAYRFLK
jgi:hypothetical protein